MAPVLTPAAAWSVDPAALLAALGSGAQGLGPREAARRLREAGRNRIDADEPPTRWRLLGRQFGSPLVLILLFGAAVSLLLRDWTEAAIIVAVVVGSALLGFAQEARASAAVARLPADAVVLQARDFLVTEAALTGESMPVEKRPGVLPAATPLAGRRNCVFLGTSVRSGTATVLVTATGHATEFGTSRRSRTSAASRCSAPRRPAR